MAKDNVNEIAEEEVKENTPGEEKDEVKEEKPKKRTSKKTKEAPAEEVKETKEPEEAEEKATEPAENSEEEETQEADTAEGEDKKLKRRKNNILRERRRAVEKDLPEDEFIKAVTSRDTFSGAIATKKRREEIMAEERVITEEGDEEVKTLSSIYKEEYNDLRGSAMNGDILTGEVIGARKIDPDNPNTTIVADIRYKTGAFKVVIPSFLLFDYDEAQYKNKQGMIDLIEAIKKRITATIKFVAAYVDESEGICYADRLRALSLDGCKHYLHNWKNTGERHIYPGLRGKGRIMAVGRQYVIVEVLGADIRIPQDELSYMHIGDARNTFTVDEIVNVYITEVSEKNVIHGRNKYTLVNAKGSIKRAYPNEKKKHFKEFPLGMYTSAEITYIDKDLHVYCLLNGGKMDCICPYPKGNPKPMVGQKRVVEITGIDEEQLRLFGTFRRN